MHHETTAAPAPLASAWAAHPLWGALGPQAALHWPARWWTLETDGTPAGPDTPLVPPPVLERHLGWLVAGRAWLVDADQPAQRLPLWAGDLCGAGATPAAADIRWAVLPEPGQPCTMALLPAEAADAMLAEHPVLAARLWPAAGKAPAPTDEGLHELLTRQPVHELLDRGPVALTPRARVAEAARCMAAHRVSSLLITSEPEGRGELLGMLTDRDLRNRVLAAGLDPDTPVMQVASSPVHTVPAQAPVFEAMLLMARHGVHHVPVVREAGATAPQLVGVVSATRLQEQHAGSPVSMAARIHRQPDVAGLVAQAQQVGQLQRQLAAAGVSAQHSGRFLTAITDALTVRLLALAEGLLGPPPVPYVWVAAGSQARAEQTARTDQDNCMVLDDAYDEAVHGRYFEALARFVCNGLDACGYVHCPGGMMAMTDTWRQPRRRWAAYFSQWVERPDPQALMLTCVFFDLRAVHGPAALLQQLRREVLQRTRGNRIFLAHMASNALGHTPALGLFGRLSPERGGPHAGTIDLKHHGIVPIVDLARIYALAAAEEAVNTHERLLAVAGSGEVSSESARDLRHALAFIGQLRLRHQALQMAAGQAPDNHLRPDSLSNFERTQLKDAFTVVQTLQAVLSQRYTAGRF